MKIKCGQDVYEVLRNGRPFGKGKQRLEAFTALAPNYFHYVAAATFPASFGKPLAGRVRAMTFAVDKPYIDTVVAAVEKRWPPGNKPAKRTGAH